MAATDPLHPLDAATKDPTSAEARFVAAARAGEVLVLNSGEPILADVIQALACGERPDWPVAPEGVRLRGGRIIGRLRLADRVLARPLWLDEADIPDGVDLSGSQTKLLSFEKSRIGNDFRATEARIDGRLLLNGAKIKGYCNISGSTIGGQFSANNATFENSDGDALYAQSLSANSVFLNQALLKGTCDINSATIRGQFSANGATFENPDSAALMAQALKAVAVFLRNATLKGVCNVNSATIGGQFAAEGATFDNPDSHALNAEALTAVDVFLDNATLKGTCLVTSATISDQLSANGATFDNPAGDAIAADFARIGAWFIRPSSGEDASAFRLARIRGRLSLCRAAIGRHFELTGVEVDGAGGVAIDARGIDATGEFQLSDSTRITGGVHLSAAVLRGKLDLTGCNIISAAQAADAETARPRVTEYPGYFIALDLSEARIDHLVMPKTADERPRGIIDLSRARIGTLTDYAAAWPAPVNRKARACKDRFCDGEGRDADHLVLDGFEYEHLDNPDGLPPGERADPRRLAKIRRNWMHAQSREDLFDHLKPQPWRHLAKILAAQGYEEEARRIAIERRVAQRYASGTGRATRALSWLLHTLADYGFNPWKAVGWSLGVILVCAAVYGWAAATYCGEGAALCEDGAVFVRTVPADFVPSVSEPDVKAQLAKLYPAFDPVSYSFDVFLPLFDVGTERFWRVNTVTWWGVVLYYFTVLEQIVGAILISLIVTGFTGLLTKDEAG